MQRVGVRTVQEFHVVQKLFVTANAVGMRSVDDLVTRQFKRSRYDE
jgi:hypothetical protein